MRGFLRGCLGMVRLKLPELLRTPEFQEYREAHERDQAAGHIDEARTEIIGHIELDEGEAAAADENRRPYAADAAPAGHRPHEPGGNDERKEGKLTAGHRAQAHLIEARDIGER